MRAVVSLCVRGLGSLSFGKVLLGALMLWMAAAFISMGGGGSAQADTAAAHDEGPVTVELVGFFDQNTDGADDGTAAPAPRWTRGAQGATSSASVSVPVSKPASRQSAPASMPASDDTAYAGIKVAPLPRATGGGQSASTPARAESQKPSGGSENFLTGLFDRLAQLWTGGGSGNGSGASSSGSSGSSGGAIGQAASRHDETVPDTVGQALAKARDTVGKAAARGSSAGQQSSEPEALRQLSRPRANAAQPASTGGSSGRSASGGQADELMGGVVDLVSGIVGTVAGKKAGDQTRQGLSGITDQVSTALRAGHKFNTSGEPGSGNANTAAQPGSRDRATQTGNGASPALPAAHKTNQPDCSGTSDCAENNPAVSGRKPATQAARGPPARPRDHDSTNGTHRKTNGPGSAKTSQAALQTGLDGKQLNKIVDKVTGGALDFTQNLLGGLSKLFGKHGQANNKSNGGSAGQQSGHSRHDDLTGKLTKLT
ncbi:hypothetical protein, partial [Pseudonocardia acaciae]|uniref:hypothetical protein n=1 Tax=Pseudonocardia acaciae TaxID=551276 RepID=UPI00048E7DCE